MILRRLSNAVREQSWFTVFVELSLIGVGVFLGIQAANWNEARLEAARKQQIIEALITDIEDSISVQQEFIDQIDAGLQEWERSHARGNRPAPYYFRIEGSDVAPDTWGTLQQMQLVDLFDAKTLFDLAFYYSETAGVGRKYVRYVSFVEEKVLPYAEEQPQIFYEDGTSNLKPVYRANMYRLKEFRDESERIMDWARCLVFRLESDKTFDTLCLREGFVLEGMAESEKAPEP